MYKKSLDLNNELIQEISEEQLSLAIKSLKPNKILVEMEFFRNYIKIFGLKSRIY